MKKLYKTALIGTLLLSMVGCAQEQKDTAVSVVTMDINPSIQLQLNQQDDVINVIASNKDAQTIIKDMDLIGADVDVAMHAIVGSMVQEGFLNEKQNTVLLSVENNNVNEKIRLEQELGQEISSLLSTYKITPAIVSQDVTKNTQLEEMATTYDISLSKAALVQDVVSKKETYKVEDLVKLSTQDLVLLNGEQKVIGEVNKSKYITQDDALAIVLKDAGLTKSKIKDLEIDYDYERGRLTYEIDFEANNFEYEYEVDAESKAIVKEVEPDEPTNKASTTKSSTTTMTTTYISKNKALSIAYKNAGVSSKNVKQLEVEFDKSDKKYEIEFKVGKKEYSYEIHAVSGKILEKDVEMDD